MHSFFATISEDAKDNFKKSKVILLNPYDLFNIFKDNMLMEMKKIVSFKGRFRNLVEMYFPNRRR